MYKIRKVTFENHPVLSDLTLDFTDSNGKAVNTVIFAGENGSGKSTIINALYENISQQKISNMIVEIETEKNL